MTVDRRVSEIMDRSPHVGFTWNDALRALDLQEYNAANKGRWSWGRLRSVKVEAKKK